MSRVTNYMCFEIVFFGQTDAIACLSEVSVNDDGSSGSNNYVRIWPGLLDKAIADELSVDK